MSRSQVFHRLNELIDEINAIKQSGLAEAPVNKRALELLERHRNDLQLIYNAHLYKLP